MAGISETLIKVIKNKGKLQLPGDEEDLAFLTVIISDELKVINSISTVILWERACELFIRLIRTSRFLNGDFLCILIHFEDDVSIHLLAFKLSKLGLAFIFNRDS